MLSRLERHPPAWIIYTFLPRRISQPLNSNLVVQYVAIHLATNEDSGAGMINEGFIGMILDGGDVMTLGARLLLVVRVSRFRFCSQQTRVVIRSSIIESRSKKQEANMTM
jgi:hypothetical protein